MTGTARTPDVKQAAGRPGPDSSTGASTIAGDGAERARAGGAGRPAAARAGLAQAVSSEWAKLGTIRSTVWTLVAATLGVPVMAAFVGATESLQPDDTVLGGSLTGAALAQLLVGVLGVLVMSSEYASGTIRVTLAACPRRTTVLAAKAVVVAGVVAPTALVGSAAAFGVGEVMLSGGGYATGDPMPALVGVAACQAVSALLVGLALGTIVRHTAGAICAFVGVTLLPSLIGPLFGDLQRWVTGASPTATLEKLTQTSDATSESVGSLGAWPSLLALAVATLAALAAARHLLERRDA